MNRLIIVSLASILFTMTVFAAPVGFRGDGTGLYPDASPASTWTDEEGILWKAKMPSWSNASPAPVGDKVFTCAEPFTLICVNAGDGAILWQAKNDYNQILSEEDAAALKEQEAKAAEIAALVKKVRDASGKLQDKLNTAEDAEKAAAAVDALTADLEKMKEAWEPTPLARKYNTPRTHGGTGYSTPTPVSDGKHVWAVFGNGLAACYTVDGERQWIRLIERPTQGHGHSASPLLIDGKLIVAVNNVYALDPKSGDEVWKAAAKPKFGTPVHAKAGDVDVIATADGQLIKVKDGKAVLAGMPSLNYNCPVAGNGHVFYINDREGKAFKLPEAIEGELKPQEAWKAKTPGGRLYASPVYHDGYVYAVADKSSIAVFDAKTGEKVHERSLGIRGDCYTSLAVAGDQLIAAAEGGEVVVLKPGRECEQVAKNKLDKLRSSPAFDNGRLYFRTMGYLYCIGK